MKDNITKKDQEKFVNELSNHLIKMGAVKQPTNELSFANNEFKLETSAGTLTITIYHHQKFLFSAYGRFDDVARAKNKFNCNPFSGKYNFHMNKIRGKRTVSDVVELAVEHFKCTLK